MAGARFPVLGPGLAGGALLIAFTLYEGSLGRIADKVPLMPLGIFGLRNLRAANLVIFLLYMAIFGFWFFQSLYMQGTLHYSALGTGVAFVPLTLAVAAGRPWRLVSRAGSARGRHSPPECSQRHSASSSSPVWGPEAATSRMSFRAASSARSAWDSLSCPRRSSPFREWRRQ